MSPTQASPLQNQENMDNLRAPQAVYSTQPRSIEPMSPQSIDSLPTQSSESEALKLRGGDRGGMCPGRFCFCIPCPFPCDFCII